MTVEQELNIQTEERPVVTFLKTAISEGAHIKTPVRTRNMIGIYFGTDYTYQQIGEMYGKFRKRDFTRQWAQQTIEAGMYRLWKNCTEEVQQRFDVKEIISDFTDHKKAKITSEIADLVRKGASHSQIRGKGYSSSQITYVRKSLKSQEVSVPYREREYDQLIKQLSEQEDRSKLKELFKQVTYYAYSHDIQGENPIFVDISTLVRNSGFYPSTREIILFVKSLENANIPTHTIEESVKSGKNKGIILNYYFTLRRFAEEAGIALLADGNLIQYLGNPVEQISGQTVDKLPTTSDFQRKRDDFKSVGALLRSLGQRFTGPGFSTERLLRDCQVPIFRYKNVRGGKREGKIYFEYRYFVEDSQELQDYFRKKFAKQSVE